MNEQVHSKEDKAESKQVLSKEINLEEDHENNDFREAIEKIKIAKVSSLKSPGNQKKDRENCVCSYV